MSGGIAGDNIPDSCRTFLWFAGWTAPVIEFLAGDASARRYFRVQQGSRTAVLMDASRAPETLPPFLKIAEHLRRLELRAPAVLARDLASGWLLLEDFGNNTFTKLLDDGRSPEELFSLAVDVLIALHKKPEAVPDGLRNYDPAAMLRDIELYLEWRTPGISESAAAEFRRVWEEVLPAAHDVPASLLLRDFHAANLMLVDGDGVRRVGLLDFQDAYSGPVTYDLASLLEDARRDLPPGLSTKLIANYLEAFPRQDKETFERSFAIVAAQRHVRVLAIFERLNRRDRKPEYQRLHSRRVRARLRKALEHPILRGVKLWMKHHGAD